MNGAPRTRWLVGGSLLLVATAGCDMRSQPAASEAQVLDLASLPRIPLVLEQRYGSAASPDSGFSDVGSVDVDRDGQVYAVDEFDLRIRVYGPTGRLVRTLGRRGEGPGEFESAPLFGVVADTVWTYDVRNHRLTLFERDGALISTAQVTTVEVPVPDQPSMTGILGPVSMGPDGRLLSAVLGYSGGGPPQTGPDTVTIPIVAWDASGRVVDTLAWQPAPHEEGLGDYLTIEGRIYTVPTPPSDRPLRLLLPDGQVVVRRSVATSGAADSTSVTRTSFSGDTLYHRVFLYRPAGYPSAVLDRLAREHALPAVALQGSRPHRSLAAERAVRARIRFPPYQPPVQDGLAGASGGVWLRREDRGEGTLEWLVLTPEGTPRGVVTLPRTARPVWAGGDRVLVVDVDTVDVPWIVAYRLGGRR